MRLIHRVLSRGQLYYEARIAPWIAKYIPWLYWPLFYLCRKFRICFVVNIAEGTGHIICELDYFLRRLHSGEIDRTKRYVWLRKPAPHSLVCQELYAHQFWWTKCSHLLYDLLLPLTIAFLDITLDCGLSRLKWQLRKDKKYFKPLSNQTYLYQLSKNQGIAAWNSYYQLRQKTSQKYPLCHGISKELQMPFLLQTDKIALIHIKTDRMNATALPTDPKSYLPALTRLVDERYQLVFVGREKMPKEFKNLPIFNYAESLFANFKNDILLFNKASLAIVGGSGVSFLADCYGKPYLYLNSWHLPMAMFSEKCILVPTLMQTKTGELIPFSQQMQIYHDLKDNGAEIFPEQEYTAKNASSDEIYEALNELLSLPTPPSFLQHRYKNLYFEWAAQRSPGALGPDQASYLSSCDKELIATCRSGKSPSFQEGIVQSPLALVQSRCSHYFLEKHQSLFEGR